MSILLLTLLKSSRGLFGDTGTSALDTLATHGSLRHTTLASNRFLLTFNVRLASWSFRLTRAATVSSFLGLGIILLAWKFVIFVIPARLDIHHNVDSKQEHVLNILRIVSVTVHPLGVLNKYFNDFNTLLLAKNLDSFVVSGVLLESV